MVPGTWRTQSCEPYATTRCDYKVELDVRYACCRQWVPCSPWHYHGRPGLEATKVWANNWGMGSRKTAGGCTQGMYAAFIWLSALMSSRSLRMQPCSSLERMLASQRSFLPWITLILFWPLPFWLELTARRSHFVLLSRLLSQLESEHSIVIITKLITQRSFVLQWVSSSVRCYELD